MTPFMNLHLLKRVLRKKNKISNFHVYCCVIRVRVRETYAHIQIGLLDTDKKAERARKGHNGRMESQLRPSSLSSARRTVRSVAENDLLTRLLQTLRLLVHIL